LAWVTQLASLDLGIPSRDNMIVAEDIV
jgi:hypothetical protein